MNNNVELKDSYWVYNDYNINNFVSELHLLYLPLVESDAIKLYQFLATKIVSEEKLSQEFLHFDISDHLFLTINEIFLARKKLEAIGLLETYFRKTSSKNQYFYKVKEPLSFAEFFENPALCQLLKNKIGDLQYNFIRKKYRRNIVSFSSFENLTAKFTDVYTNDYYDSYSFENIQKAYKGLNYDNYSFDIAKLNYLLTNSYLDNLLDNTVVKEKVISLAHLYKASVADMAKAIEKSIKNDASNPEIDFELLSDHLVQLFVNVKKQDVPKLENMLDRNILESTKEEKLTVEEKFVREVDNMSYVDFLNKRFGIILSTVDGRNISNLQSKYNFPTGVLNILLEHAIRNSNSNSIPNFNYMDKIASEWSGKKFLGAQDAILYIRTTQKDYKKTQTPKKQFESNVRNNRKNVIKAPDYIASQIEELNTGQYNKTEITEEDEQEHAKLLEELRKRGSNR